MPLGAGLPLLPGRVLGVAEVDEDSAFFPGNNDWVLVPDAGPRS